MVRTTDIISVILLEWKIQIRLDISNKCKKIKNLFSKWFDSDRDSPACDISLYVLFWNLIKGGIWTIFEMWQTSTETDEKKSTSTKNVSIAFQTKTWLLNWFLLCCCINRRNFWAWIRWTFYRSIHSGWNQGEIRVKWVLILYHSLIERVVLRKLRWNLA